jgi:RNA polymerase sigma factor (sigma-70 family)
MPKSKLQFTDSQFIDGLKTNSNEVLTALYKKYYSIVLKFIVSNNGTQEEAQDVYQETIIIVYENVRKVGFELNCQLQTYIYAIAKRLWLKQLKQNGKTFLFRENEEHELADVTNDINDYLKTENDILKINKSMQLLGEPCNTILTDFYILKLNMDEIAEKFGYTNSDNAKTQKYKCLQRLKKFFFEKQIAQELN